MLLDYSSGQQQADCTEHTIVLMAAYIQNVAIQETT
jgi:hypothetical protein